MATLRARRTTVRTRRRQIAHPAAQQHCCTCCTTPAERAHPSATPAARPTSGKPNRSGASQTRSCGVLAVTQTPTSSAAPRRACWISSSVRGKSAAVARPRRCRRPRRPARAARTPAPRSRPGPGPLRESLRTSPSLESPSLAEHGRRGAAAGSSHGVSLSGRPARLVCCAALSCGTLYIFVFASGRRAAWLARPVSHPAGARQPWRPARHGGVTKPPFGPGVVGRRGGT